MFLERPLTISRSGGEVAVHHEIEMGLNVMCVLAFCVGFLCWFPLLVSCVGCLCWLSVLESCVGLLCWCFVSVFCAVFPCWVSVLVFQCCCMCWFSSVAVCAGFRLVGWLVGLNEFVGWFVGWFDWLVGLD